MTDPVATRLSLHAVAEHVLGAALHAATGKIGLRRSPGGFGTPWFPGPTGSERRISVVGVELLVEDADGERSQPLTTVRAAAAFADVEPGGPADVYTLSTPLEPDAPLTIDAEAAARIGWWFALVDEALARFTAEIAEDDPATVQLWPEHFDLATSAAEVNYGGSPVDAAIPEPYLYVGPWTPREGAFWDKPWGASRLASQIPDVEAAVSFLHEGRSAARG